MAVACGERGLGVLVAGGPNRGWGANYGVWVDEFEALGLEEFLGPVWRDSVVHLAQGERRELGRAYGRIARGRFRGHLLKQCEQLGVHLRWESVLDAAHGAQTSRVRLSDGTTVHARMVVDASGHKPVLVHREGEPTSWQAAYGVLGTVNDHPWDRERMTFMDLRQPPAVDALSGVDATFLYAMPLAPRRLFVEETSMVRAPAMPFAGLRRRLDARLQAACVRFEEIETLELCLIPMDSPLPELGQRVVGFGGAASMVHPATGYVVARVMREAPGLAEVIAQGLDAGRLPSEIARDAWGYLWPEDRLVARQLYLYGSRVLMELDPVDTAEFFRTFFSLNDDTWRAYLRGDAELGLLVRTMLAMFGRSDSRLRWMLARRGYRLPAAMARRASA